MRRAPNAHTQTNTHAPEAAGAVQRSVISSVTPLLCVILCCADRSVHIHTCKQMENSIRKPQGSNFTNAIFHTTGVTHIGTEGPVDTFCPSQPIQNPLSVR